MTVRFCDVCDSLMSLPVPELGMSHCRECHKSIKIEDGEEIYTTFYSNNEKARKKLEDNDVHNLTNQITTQIVQKKCFNEKCTSDVLKLMYDDDYRFIYSCPVCRSIFR